MSEAAHAPDAEVCPHCRQEMGSRQRSDEHHRFFFAVIREAFRQWPETHAFQPNTERHLYGWLLIEAGHHESMEIECSAKQQVLAGIRAMFQMHKREIHCVRAFQTRNGVRIAIPKSLKYREAGKKQFEAITEKVFEIISTTINVPIDQLKQAARREPT